MVRIRDETYGSIQSRLEKSFEIFMIGECNRIRLRLVDSKHGMAF